ncbi:MAG: dihydroneopterin aldolase [Alphaproteobacteria bacterium]|nr:dihydroneopterin aldolase [Alphaproteobacteria bacterium]
MTGAPEGIDHRVFVRGLMLSCFIGAHPHERLAPQRVRVDIELAVAARPPEDDTLVDVVDYERVVNAVRRIAAEGHINLVETLAERIAASCLGDGRVVEARVRVAKPDVFDDVDEVGVEVVRGHSGRPG